MTEGPVLRLAEIRATLEAREAWMRAARDRQGAFAAAYVEVTAAMQADLGAGRYQHPDWVAACAAHFSGQYLAALDAAERGWWWQVPQAWALALREGRRREGSHLGSLLLGMNAHINHDLPISIADTLPAVGDKESFAEDYRRILGTLWRSIAPIQHRICRDYAPGLGRLDRLGRGVDDGLTLLGVWAFRGESWRWALRLARASEERAALRARLDHRACRFGRLLCREDRVITALAGQVRRLERAAPPFPLALSEARPSSSQTSHPPSGPRRPGR